MLKIIYDNLNPNYKQYLLTNANRLNKGEIIQYIKSRHTYSSNHLDACFIRDNIIPIINTRHTIKIPITPVILQGNPKSILKDPSNVTPPYMGKFYIDFNNFGEGIGNFLDHQFFDTLLGGNSGSRGIKIDKTFFVRNQKFLVELSLREKVVLSGYSYQGDRLANYYLRNYDKGLNDYIEAWSPSDVNLNPLYFQLLDEIKKRDGKDIGDIDLDDWLKSSPRDDKFISLINSCVKQYVKELVEIFHKAPEIRENTVVFRGTKTYYYKESGSSLYSNVDIMSTSLNPTTAFNYTGSDGCCFNQIVLKPGTKAIFMEPITQYTDEMEIILAPENKFKIVSNATKEFVSESIGNDYIETLCFPSSFKMRYTILETVS